MQIKKYVKRPLQIEAVRFDGSMDMALDIENWCNGSHTPAKIEGAVLRIITLDGPKDIIKGDYVIKGTKGEFYPCKPDMFYEVYREV